MVNRELFRVAEKDFSVGKVVKTDLDLEKNIEKKIVRVAIAREIKGTENFIADTIVNLKVKNPIANIVTFKNVLQDGIEGNSPQNILEIEVDEVFDDIRVTKNFANFEKVKVVRTLVLVDIENLIVNVGVEMENADVLNYFENFKVDLKRINFKVVVIFVVHLTFPT